MKISLQNNQTRIPLKLKTIKKALKKLEKVFLFKNYQFSVSIVSDATIKKINKKYHKTNTSTDVLSFEISLPVELSTHNRKGDVIISADTAKKNANFFKNPLEKELVLYIIHGMLHLIGFDDTTKIKAKKMQRIQEMILKKVWN